MRLKVTLMTSLVHFLKLCISGNLGTSLLSSLAASAQALAARHQPYKIHFLARLRS